MVRRLREGVLLMDGVDRRRSLPSSNGGDRKDGGLALDILAPIMDDAEGVFITAALILFLLLNNECCASDTDRL